jgi:hypothetical protein
MSTITTIEGEFAALPPNLRAEVLDFMRFVKQRHGLPTTGAAIDPDAPPVGDSDLFRALEAAGFVGCIESDEQLSTTYKSRLDFSGKRGATG